MTSPVEPARAPPPMTRALWLVIAMSNDGGGPDNRPTQPGVNYRHSRKVGQPDSVNANP